MTADARFFYAALEGASEAAAETAVVPFPSLQVDPYRGMTPHFRVAAARARALHPAATGQARLIVASAAALLPRVSPPERLLRASIEIRSGTEIEPQDLADLLVDAGFTREDPVDEHGAFTIRGGIVDIFPAADAEPVRLEFVGDMVETLRRFDPATQRSTARHRPGAWSSRCARRFDVTTTSTHEPHVSMLEFLVGTRRAAARVRARTGARAGDPGARAARGQLSATPAAAGRRGCRRREAFIDLGRPGRAARRRADGSRSWRSASRDPGRAQVRCQPAMEFHGRVGDWIADLRQARERGDTVLFVADSPGRAERTVEILQEYDIVAVPVERAEDAHAAAVLVAVGTLSRGFRLADAGAAGLRRDRRLRRGAPRRRPAPQPRQDVPVRPARPEGRRSRRARRPRHRRVRRPQAARRQRQPRARRSFSSFAITATTSCSSRSSGSI